MRAARSPAAKRRAVSRSSRTGRSTLPAASNASRTAKGRASAAVPIDAWVRSSVWKSLPKDITVAKPDTVIYQITTYDWGSTQEQQAGYERLLSTVTAAGAKLVIVTMPPIKPDDFYRPHLKDLKHAAQSAQTVADASHGQAVVLDASQVWGATYQRIRDGKTDRSSDGIHTCPQGAARFTSWLLDEMTKIYPAFTPPTATKWANTGWAGDKRFIGC